VSGSTLGNVDGDEDNREEDDGEGDNEEEEDEEEGDDAQGPPSAARVEEMALF
jgi:hypothetical protein